MSANPVRDYILQSADVARAARHVVVSCVESLRELASDQNEKAAFALVDAEKMLKALEGVPDFTAETYLELWSPHGSCSELRKLGTVTDAELPRCVNSCGHIGFVDTPGYGQDVRRCFVCGSLLGLI